MGIEVTSHETNDSKTSSKRLMFAMRTLTRMSAGEIGVHGRENLKEIPVGAKVVIATTHITDNDVPIAAVALGDKFDLVITDQSVHRTSAREFLSYIGESIAGWENFIPISWNFGKGGKKHGKLNPKDFDNVRAAMEKGKTPLVAAHNPSFGVLPPKPGIGAQLLAETTPGEVVILPVSVDVQYEHPEKTATTYQKLRTLFRKPKAVVTIGHPIIPKERIDSADLISSLEHPANEVRHTVSAMRDRSRIIMQELAKMLPESKRGTYGTTQKE